MSEFRALYNELQSFKDTDAFKKYGLATAGPYNDWLKRVKGFENKYDGNILLDRGIFIGDLGSLGYHYVGSKGKETAVTQSLNKILLDGLSKKESPNEGPVAVAGSGLKNYEEIKRKYQLFGKWTLTLCKVTPKLLTAHSPKFGNSTISPDKKNIKSTFRSNKA